MKRENWKIFINCGYKSEFAVINPLLFRTRAEACQWARINGYPLACVVRESIWNEWQHSKIFHRYG